MLKVILVGIAAIAVVFLVVVALRPSAFRISRSSAIGAPPPVVFAQVNDFHAWEAWNPFAKADPSIEYAYEGAPAGPGASVAWVGNRDVGEGRMTIVESRPNEAIRIKLEFFKPFAATNTAEFHFEPASDGTAVTWSMFGQNGFMAKAIGLFMNMDKMIGDQFEKGLADIESIAETTARR